MSGKRDFAPHKLTGVALLLLLLLLSGCGRNTAPPPITIGVIGDQTGAEDLDAAFTVLDSAISRINARNPQVVVHVGDLVESIKDIDGYDTYKKNFQTATGMLDRLDAPWYLTTGDHDVNPPRFQPNSPDRSREKWFQDLCADYGLPVQDHLYYSENVRGYHFIFLNSMEHLHSDPRWGPIFLDHISKEQLEWLAGDLEKNKNANGIVVILHHPQWYVDSWWYPVHDLLRKYPVTAVIAGHFHYDQVDHVLDGIHYYVMGATGGAVKDSDPASGGIAEYGMLTIQGRKVLDFTLRDVATDDTVEFTPRISMDRIQAVSSMFSNLWQDESLRWADGRASVVGMNGTLSPAKTLGLESLGNPLDIPMKLEMLSHSPTLLHPRWMESKGAVEATSPITLPPADRVGWSNLTSVGNWWTLPPLFVADISPDLPSNSPPLEVTLKAEFEDSRTRWVEYKASYSISK